MGLYRSQGLMLALFSGVAAGLMLIGTARYGIGMSTDPVAYVSTARNLVAGNGWVGYYGGFAGQPLLYWPPLYPALLALLGWLGMEAMAGARLLNALSLAAVVWLGGAWLAAHLRHRWLAWMGTLAIVLAPALLRSALQAFSEPLFVALLLGSLLALERRMAGGRWPWLALAAGSAALACLARYLGFTLVVAGVGLLLIGTRGGWRARLQEAGAFALAGLPLAAWWARNWSVSGTLMGERVAVSIPIERNVAGLVYHLGRWLVPNPVPAPLAFLALAGLLLLVGVALLRGHGTRARHVGLSPLLPALAFMGTYSGFLFVSAFALTYVELLERYFVPLYLPMLWVVLFALDRIESPRIRQASVAGLALWVALSGVRGAGAVAQAAREGAGGYTSAVWRETEVIRFLAEAPLEGAVFSNEPYALFVYTGMEATLTPRQVIPSIVPGSPEEDLRRFRNTVLAAPESYLVWINNSETRANDSMLEPEALRERAGVRLEVVARLTDGVVYRVVTE